MQRIRVPAAVKGIKPVRLLIFLGTLRTGGAERQTCQLAVGLARRRHDVVVCTLHPGGQFWDFLRRQPDVRLTALFSARPAHLLQAAWQLFNAPGRLRRACADRDVVYSLLYLSNLIAWAAVRGATRSPLAWGLRNSDLPTSWKGRLPFEILRRVASQVPLVIVNSERGQRFYREWGLAGQRTVVIRNGIDLGEFSFDATARERVRREWDIAPTQRLVGMVGRLAPEKDYETFLHAAALVAQADVSTAFVAIGPEMAGHAERLRALALRLGLRDRLHWAGARQDMQAVYSALDVFCLTSYMDGTANVLAEAMACGLSCVATDAGDNKTVIGPWGRVVAAGDAAGFAAAVQAVLATGPRRQDTACRQHVAREFSDTHMVERTEAALSSLAASTGRS